MSRQSKAFTLVEILIVVVILGILAGIVVPQFGTATTDAEQSAVADQVTKLRRVLAVYYVRNGNTYPTITAGNGTWGELIVPGSSYMRQAPANPWVGGANAKTIIIRATPDTAFQTNYGWIWNPLTGDLWAGGFDGQDQPLPRP
jgi:prepilin-type N-terminal cleavage/methylation domain-containing protein